MLKTLAWIILYGVVAWFLSPVLEVILPIPTESMVEGFLNPADMDDKNVLHFLRFIVWMVAIGLIFKYAGSVFSFALPITKRYSTTKLFRRFQGLIAEVMIFALLFIITGLALSIYPSYKIFQEKVADKEDDWKDVYAEERFALNTQIKATRDSAKNFIEKYKAKFTIPSNIWPIEQSKNIEKYSLKDVRAHPEKYQKRHYLGNGLYRYDIRRIQGYQDLFDRQKQLFAEKNTLDSQYNAAFLNEDFLAYNKTVAKGIVWAELGSPYDLLVTEFKNRLFLIILMTIGIFTALYYANKSSLGGLHEKFLRFLEQGRLGLGGSARFAGLYEEWRTLYKNQRYGLFMGRSLYNPFLNIGLEDSRHMLTIAGSRAGKGATVIIPNLLLWKGSALVIDPKGTNAIVTANRRRKMGQNVYLIDPFDIVDDEDKASFNPLSLLDPDSPVIREQINVIAEALVVPDENQKEKHWDDGARTVIAGMLAHLITSDKYENPTLPMLRDLISIDTDKQAELWAEMSFNDAAGRLPMDAANRLIRGAGTNEISSILSNADKHTEWLSSPAIKETLSSSSFSFEDLKDEPTTIYLVLPPQFLETHNRFLRLFVNLAISSMAVEGKAKEPVLLLMDEFLALGKMEEVEKAFGLMAGYNLVMWPFVQDYGRLKHLYGSSVNAFIANSRAIQVFGVGDEETKEFVNKHIGQRYLPPDKKRRRYNDVVDLRPQHEVAIDIGADTGRQYILRSGKAPLIIEKVPYYDSAPVKWLKPFDILGKKRLGVFDGMYDKDPDYRKA